MIINKNEELWFESVRKADLVAMESILDNGFDVNTIGHKNCNTALIEACFRDDVPIVNFLIKHKCNLNLTSNCTEYTTFQGPMTALTTAAGLGHTQCVARLLKAGAKVTNANIHDSLQVSLTKSPLLRALHGGHFEAAFLLIAKGAEVDMQQIKNTSFSGSVCNEFAIVGVVEHILDEIQIIKNKNKLEKGIKKLVPSKKEKETKLFKV